MQTEACVVPITSAPSFAGRRRPSAQSRELERLLAAVAAGEERAWRTIVESFGGCIRAVARAHRLSPDDSEDVLQHSWTRLLENAAAIREPKRLGAWLRTTARHESLRLLRAAGRERPTDADLLERQPTYDDDDSRAAKEAERLRGFGRAVQTLPARQRQLVQTLVAEPKPSYAEVSRALQMPIGSIGPTRARTIERLRSHPALNGAA